jgi:hypothetical protein
VKIIINLHILHLFDILNLDWRYTILRFSQGGTMLKKTTLLTVLLYVCAILLGAAFGPSIVKLTGRLQVFHQEPVAALAAPASEIALAPESPEALFTCTPLSIAVFSNRIHVKCTAAAPPGGAIWYFAAPTGTDPKYANRVLSIMLTAKALGKNLLITYDLAGSGSAYGCLFADCRPIQAIELLN